MPNCEREYILTRCPEHPEHFFIRDRRDGSECVQIFNEQLARKVDDLEQLNHAKGEL